jgi:hypothetical protein
MSDAEKLDAIREVFRQFEWGSSDCQYALEEIEGIVDS